MSTQHTPGPYIVRGELVAGAPGYAMGVEPATDSPPRACGWPYFIREDREFPLGSGPLWLAHGIQRKADADLFAAAPDLLAIAKAALAFIEADSPPCGPGECVGSVSAIDLKTGQRREVDLFAARAAIAKAEGRS